MIYVFGSLHIDPGEVPELKRMLSKVNRRGGVIAIELESNMVTTTALKRFRSLNSKQIRKILVYEFGKRRVIAPFNFMKLAQRYPNLSMVSIEPKQDKAMHTLNNKIKVTYVSVTVAFHHAKSHPFERIAVDNLLKLYFDFQLCQIKQCRFRERNMKKVVKKLSKASDVLLYCGFSHSANIKESFRKEGIRFRTRTDPCIVKLEKRCQRLDKMLLANNFGTLSRTDRLGLYRNMLSELVAWWSKPGDLTIKQYYLLDSTVRKRINSARDIICALADFEGFRNSVIKR